MPTLDEGFRAALAYHQAGRLDEAEELYRQILAVVPGAAEVLHLLGLVAHQRGLAAEAAEWISRAIAADGNQPHFHNNLGEIYRREGRLAEAAECFERALSLNGGYAEACSNLGLVRQAQRRGDEAMRLFRRATELSPGYVDGWNNLGTLLAQQGRLEEAAAVYRRALEIDPQHAAVYHNLGGVLLDQGYPEQALDCRRRALELRPHYAGAYEGVGSALMGLAQYREAIAYFNRAIELDPGLVEAHNNLGVAWTELDDLAKAEACLRRALALKPDYAEAYTNLSLVERDQGRIDAAAASLEAALRLKPELAEAHNNLAGLRQWQGDLDGAIACHRRALELKPDFASAHSGILSLMQYRSGVTPEDLLTAHQEYERLHAAALRAAWQPHGNSRIAGRRLRLGFVSPDLGRHPVGYLVWGAIEHLDRSQFELYCYSDRTAADDLTAGFQRMASRWQSAVGWSDARLAEAIRADGIDILFDLAGHTPKNRMLAFARKPAPIQISWAGYVGTTGLAAIDYLLADRWHVPEGDERYYVERVLRMPDGYVSYTSPPGMPEVSPLPALKTGRITFAAFHNPTKISRETIACWGRILRQLPGSRLLVKYRAADFASVVAHLRRLWAAEHIEAERVQLLGWSPWNESMAVYRDADIALDTFPYSGGVTTCEAMWMGLPVVTCPGRTFAGRHSLSHLSNVGLKDTIAGSVDEYADLAVGLAQDLPRLARLRQELRPRMLASPLADGRRFARHLGGLLRRLWQDWLQS